MMPIVVNERLDLMGMDILGPLPLSRNGFRYVLVFSDYYTKMPYCFALRDIKVITIARIFLYDIYLRVGKPKRLVSDCGANLIGKVMQAFTELTDVTHSKTTPYHPQTDGLVERFNNTLCA